MERVSSDATACDVTTLDEFFADHPIPRADVLKIDVEGFELRVLRGGRRLIGRLRPRLIQLEYYPEYPRLPRDEWPTLAVYKSFFEEMEYDGFFCVNERTGRLEPLAEDNPQDNDIFCIDKRLPADLRHSLLT